MLKDNFYSSKISINKNKQKKAVSKEKAQLINDRNIQKDKFRKREAKRLTIFALSNTKINELFSMSQGMNINKNESNLNICTHKRHSRIKIDSINSKKINNLKKPKTNREDKNEISKVNNDENKENIVLGKQNNNYNYINNKDKNKDAFNIYHNNLYYNYNNKKRKTKSFDNKKSIQKEKQKVGKNFLEKIKETDKAFRNTKYSNKNSREKKDLIRTRKERIDIISKNIINSNRENSKENNNHKKLDKNNKNKLNNNIEKDEEEKMKEKDNIFTIREEKSIENTKDEIINDKIEPNKDNNLFDFKNNNANTKNEIIQENIEIKNTNTTNNINNDDNIANKKEKEEEKNNVKHSNDNNNDIKIKKDPENEAPILKLNSDKNKNNIIIEEEKNQKENTPLLILNSENSSSTGNSYPKGIVTNSDNSDSSIYESVEGLEIKGELLTKNKKQNFLNNLKKCLFNGEILFNDNNLKKILNSNNSNNSNNNINSNNIEEEDFSFKNTINLQKKKTEEMINENEFYLNLKQNISLTESQIIEQKPQIKSFTVSKPGINDNKVKKNQDSYLVLENIFEQKLNIYGVFDGHGKNGHLISNLVSQFLSQYFVNKKNYYISKKKDTDTSDLDSSESIKSEDISINNEVLQDIFSEKNNFVENTIKTLVEKSNECNFNLELSGTTCVLLFILDNKLICSNIGDSQCVVFNCSNEERWTHEMISVIHKPDVPKEKERILENGGVIHPYYDEQGIYEGPDRVYVKNKTYPGLCLTRSIGDLLGEEVGIISEPDIVIKNIDSTCKYIILGSDGLWDMVKPYDVIRIVNPFFNKGDPEGACNALLKRAEKNWEKEGCERDDITIIVVFIGEPNKLSKT